MITLVLPYPPSVNTYWRSLAMPGNDGRGAQTRVVISAGGLAYRAAVAKVIGQKRLERALSHAPILDRISVAAVAYMPDRRARDLDNLPKAMFDALTEAGVWKDDSQIDDMRIVRGSEIIAGGAVVLTITPMQAQGRAA